MFHRMVPEFTSNVLRWPGWCALLVAAMPIDSLAAAQHQHIAQYSPSNGVVASNETLIDVADDADEIIIIDQDTEGEPITVELQDTPSRDDAEVKHGASESQGFSVDRLWAEYGVFPDDDSAADGQGYLSGRASLNWNLEEKWEFKLSGRIDGYYQHGTADAEELKVDYGESWIRYNKDRLRMTLGAQKILWGRIDELPPTDRLSTQDLSRFILDDMTDRRRASLAMRLEYFVGNNKLDAFVLPRFRGAELPDKDSVWFPINQREGVIIGLEPTPLSRTIIRNSKVSLDEHDSEGGAGIRFTGITPMFDYGLTAQKGRATTPYFAYDPARNVLESVYPRTWVLGGDVGFEALGGTLRLEAAWLSDTPLTEINGEFSTTESINWGVGLELFPGDGDARLNLQITGFSLLDAGPVLDREETYSFNGTFDMPFANDKWQLNIRFYTGINEHDVYVNPELSYRPRNAYSIYLAGHYFAGSEETPGGFHQDNSVVTVGWRAYF
ncbi:hypothetical protein DWB85_15910 [Seongchinamella sediminis]|uniref:Alginate export domain-containing protein n=1 Tax=Seongchinamella sediminis TaxID=2283635 RepID=A0A3L7DW09_9GAMM|nr:hypothetical protein [Seongchinamella sediminis]RLQ20739.1 hypothetical protein DWB85_15910 [Seongchinamella sediminis]